jgi:predicted N-acetyltransferase YhbS
MPTIRTFIRDDMPSVTSLLTASYNRPDEVAFLQKIVEDETYIPDLSLVAEDDRKTVGFILLTRIGIRTANEILPTLGVQLFSVDPNMRGRGVGGSLFEAAVDRARNTGFTSVVTTHCGSYFKRFGFLPARDEFGLELYFAVADEDFLALELEEDALYRKSGFLLYPEIFSFLRGSESESAHNF